MQESRCHLKVPTQILNVGISTRLVSFQNGKKNCREMGIFILKSVKSRVVSRGIKFVVYAYYVWNNFKL